MTGIICSIQKNSQSIPNRIALIEGKRKLTYRQLHNTIEATRNNIKSKGIKAGDRVGIIADKSLEAVVLLHALWREGAISVMINARSSAATINARLKDVGAKHVLADKKYLRRSADLDIRSLLDNKKAGTSNTKISRFVKKTPAVVLFTSGSTGSPKAALLSYSNLHFNAKGVNTRVKLRADDSWLLSLPIYHVGGLSIIFRSFLAGSTLVLSKTNKVIAHDLKHNKITHISLVPTQLIQLLDQKNSLRSLKKCKCIMLGGASLPKNLIDQALKLKLSLYASYGLTEMASQVATTPKITLKNSLQLKGKVLPGCQVMISRAKEICVKGKSLFLGYISKGKLLCGTQRNGYFNTHDLGRLTSRGKLIVLGRADNLLISGGENIQPEEIESHLNSSFILRSCVIARKDKIFGARPVVFIETRSSRKIRKSLITRNLLDKLEKYKIPDEWYYWPESIDQRQLKTSRRKLSQFYQTNKDKLVPIN